ncbi:hypothetical protein [Polaromonas hydrogenivorans]|uniref:DUF3138 domain-containing protein n=1 Tax=Polaromonas hydrogenivorans TaxID=335476 RepID=A0AAU7LSV7_9BURK
MLLALSSGAVQAQPNNEIKALKSVVNELQKQLQELKKSNSGASTSSLEQARLQELAKQVSELRAQLAKQQAAAQATQAAASSAEGESQESIDARTAATKADIQGMRTDLENYKYDQSRLLERNVPSVTRNTKIGGSVTVRYDIQNPAAQPSASSSGNGPTDPRNRGFNASAVGLNFAGNLYRDYAEGRNLTYRLALTSQNTASSSSTGVNLTDAYLRYSFQPASGNPEDSLGTITLGQQTVPFGLDAQALDPEVKAVIDNAGFVAGLGLNTRQTGLVVSGDYDPYVDFTNNYRAPLLTYSLGVFNGNGANKADNNNYLDTIGRLVYTLPVDYSSWLRQLQIGGSYYRGYTSLGPASTTATTVATRKGHYDRYGVDVNWTHLPYSVAYERAYGKQELLTASPASPDSYQRSMGQYINFGYTWGEQFLASSKQQGKFDDYWPKSFQTFIRFDDWNPNRSGLVVNDKVFVATLGLNVFFAETTKFQINYKHIRNQLGGAAPTADKPASVNAIQALLNATF